MQTVLGIQVIFCLKRQLKVIIFNTNNFLYGSNYGYPDSLLFKRCVSPIHRTLGIIDFVDADQLK